MPSWCCLHAIVWLMITLATTSANSSYQDNNLLNETDATLSATNINATTLRLLNTSNTDTTPAFLTEPSFEVNNSTEAKCPTTCQCDHKLFNVQCSNASLLQVPSAIPKQVQHLQFYNNLITHLPFLGDLPDLQTLDLSTNNLQTISSDAFNGTPSLQQLNLHGNLLNQLVVRSLAVDGSSLLAHLAVLNVSNNNLTEWPTAEWCDGDNSSLSVLDLSRNYLSSVPHFQMFNNLEYLFLQHNSITNLTHAEVNNGTFAYESTDNSTESNTTLVSCPSLTKGFHRVIHINFSYNKIAHVDANFFSLFSSLQQLDLSHNMLQSVDFLLDIRLSNLSRLILSYNPIIHLPNNVFTGCPQLHSLHLSHMSQLAHINSNTFSGLHVLEELLMDHCASFHYVHATAFSPLTNLQVLDMSFTGITTLHYSTFDSFTARSNSTNSTTSSSSLRLLNLQGVTLTCSCNSAWLQHWSMLNSSQLIPSNLTCSGILTDNTSLSHVEVSEFPFDSLNCTGATIESVLPEQSVEYKIGSVALLNCRVDGEPEPGVIWTTPLKHVMTYHPSFVDHSDYEPEDDAFHAGHYWHEGNAYYSSIPLADRIYVLKNGSLYIDYVTRKDAGQYKCAARNHLGNETLVISLMLDYHIIIETRLWCAIIGWGTAFSFLIFGLTTGVIRYVANFCSRKEREKRRSIKKLLIQIQEYKTEKVDVIKAYRTAKLDKISAFKNHKIDRLRLYKQSTVTNILAYMQSMREHYQIQMSKVKENYTEQTGKLRDNYTTRVTKIKDYKSEKIEMLCDNYQFQAIKLRDYGSAQMQRLREQYKVQQQHLLKLLELLDVGNCMSVIEAECMRTESIIFDPEMMFDLEAPPPPPVHADFLPPHSDDSEYITAGSVSDLSFASPLGQNLNSSPDQHPGNTQIKETTIKPEKLKRRKRRSQHSVNVHSVPQWLDLAGRKNNCHESSPELEGLPSLKKDKTNRKRKKLKPAKTCSDSEVESTYTGREDSDVISAMDSSEKEDKREFPKVNKEETSGKDEQANHECVVIMCPDEREEKNQDTSV